MADIKIDPVVVAQYSDAATKGVAAADVSLARAISAGGAPVRIFRRQAESASDDPHAPRLFAIDDVMAIEPSALERAYTRGYVEGKSRPYAVAGKVAIVAIDGPLMQRSGSWDGYDAIRSRFAAAIADHEVEAVVLKISSPGGVCAGCFSAVRAMRELKAQSGKLVIAFADEHAFSAAYAMASVADEIYLPKEGGVGSVGVIGVLEDWTAAAEQMGIRVAVITSGKQKADGHPFIALKPDVLARTQARINSLAVSFAEAVGEARGMTPEAVLALEAACLFGDDAVKAGLADGVLSLEQVLDLANTRASTRATTSLARASAPETQPMTTKNDAPAAAKIETLTSELTVTHSEFALAAGLSHDASRGDVLAEMARVRGDHEALLGVCGAKNKADAIGKVTALVERAEAGDKAVAELAGLKVKQEAADASALIAKAISDGKVASNGEKAHAIFAKFGMEALQAHLDALTPQAALANKAPASPAPKNDSPPAAKTDADEKLSAEDEKLIKAMDLDRDKFIAQRAEERKTAALAPVATDSDS